MNGLKIFLIILFIAGLLFILGIMFGSTHADDQNARTPGWLSDAGARLVGPQPLKPGDLSPVSASCLQQGNIVVPVGATCTFSIQQSTFTERKATVQLLQGVSALVTVSQEQVMPVQDALTGTGAVSTADLKIYPGKSQGMLEVQCLAAGEASACLLKLA